MKALALPGSIAGKTLIFTVYILFPIGTGSSTEEISNLDGMGCVTP